MAEPVSVAGNPRNVLLSAPIAVPNAPCGIVDILDFPLDPPNANQVSFGAQDFGLYRRRFNGFHTGEDWWKNRGRSNFGVPVYVIGHGVVTYAEPLGWGRDKGVVIIRHLFSDGNEILSFYGHLDPPSVKLDVGDCVKRGEQIGKIGNPTSGPHLHFEIRSHMPYEPGRGYGPEHPEDYGWKSPTKFILDNRISSAPGVRWYRPRTEGTMKGIGLYDNQTFLAIENGLVVALSVEDGGVRWNLPGPENTDGALIDGERGIIYTANRRGTIEAHQLNDHSDSSGELGLEIERLWLVDLDAIGAPTLVPLPNGSLAVFAGRTSTAFSAEGHLHWQNDGMIRPLDWVLMNQALVLSTSGRDGGLWSIDEKGMVPWENSFSGKLFIFNDRLLLYNSQGIYELDINNRTADLLYGLPRSFLGLGDGIVSPDAGLLLAHRDLADERLILLEENGNVIWERSYAATEGGRPRLMELDENFYLTLSNNDHFLDQIVIFSVDMEQSTISRLFETNQHPLMLTPFQVFPIANDLMLIYAGDGLIAFDPEQAKAIVQ